jgi:hypothetical protein
MISHPNPTARVKPSQDIHSQTMYILTSCNIHVCVCVCVCVRERERASLFLSSTPPCTITVRTIRQFALLAAELEESEARIDAICDRYGNANRHTFFLYTIEGANKLN